MIPECIYRYGIKCSKVDNRPVRCEDVFDLYDHSAQLSSGWDEGFRRSTKILERVENQYDKTSGYSPSRKQFF